MSEAQKKASAKYDKTHTRQIVLKLNLKTDADILARLDAMPNKQGYIKNLIRKDRRESPLPSAQQGEYPAAGGTEHL